MKVHRGFQWNCELPFCPLFFCLGLTQFGQAASTPHHISTASKKKLQNNCPNWVCLWAAAAAWWLVLCLHIISRNVCLFWERNRESEKKKWRNFSLCVCLVSDVAAAVAVAAIKQLLLCPLLAVLKSEATVEEWVSECSTFGASTSQF